ncbi:hypothetical protein [Silvimonas sp.]|uniref:hypothetical protein n=1 Tax=Silvimonas sp. TaxID=2650811 RepID=UPI0028504195|nr:hypothetical protein [Silvimonas sp.]MDR3426919.1 hypothetical protein [Silvimonas sp.]
MNEPMNTVFVPIGLIMVAAKMGWDWYKTKRTQNQYKAFRKASKPGERGKADYTYDPKQFRQERAQANERPLGKEKRPNSTISQGRPPRREDQSPAFRQLKTACNGDLSIVERLIAYEFKKGSKTRMQAIENAFDRLKRDRRYGRP